jgi:hypothetical protein
MTQDCVFLEISLLKVHIYYRRHKTCVNRWSFEDIKRDPIRDLFYVDSLRFCVTKPAK